MEKPAAACYHLPGLFEFYELYRRFLPLYREHREYFYDWCTIGSIYGAPAGCIWGGGRISCGGAAAHEVLALLWEYGISGRLTFSNSLLRAEHLADQQCNALCEQFAKSGSVPNGVIVHSDLLADYLRQRWPELYLVSSTTKVLTEFAELRQELEKPQFRYVVPDFRLNRAFEQLRTLPQSLKDKTEFLCNECCWFGCKDRKACAAPDAAEGYRFSKAMRSPGFIGTDDIRQRYLPAGFSQFKIEGRGLGSALVLEFLLYYMTKPEYQLQVREAIYLDNMLDLF